MKWPLHSKMPEMYLVVIKPLLINLHPSYYTARGQLILTNAFSLNIMKGYHMVFIAQRAGKGHETSQLKFCYYFKAHYSHKENVYDMAFQESVCLYYTIGLLTNWINKKDCPAFFVRKYVKE